MEINYGPKHLLNCLSWHFLYHFLCCCNGFEPSAVLNFTDAIRQPTIKIKNVFWHAYSNILSLLIGTMPSISAAIYVHWSDVAWASRTIFVLIFVENHNEQPLLSHFNWKQFEVFIICHSTNISPSNESNAQTKSRK